MYKLVFLWIYVSEITMLMNNLAIYVVFFFVKNLLCRNLATENEAYNIMRKILHARATLVRQCKQ